MKDAEEYAVQFANRAVTQAPKGSVTVDTVQKQVEPVGVTAPLNELGGSGTVSAPTSGMSPEEELKLAKKMQANIAIRDNPRSTPDAVASSKRILAQMQGDYQPAFNSPSSQVAEPSAKIVSTTTSQPQSAPALQYKDKPREAGRTEEFKEVGQGYGKQYADVMKSADTARSTLDSISNIERNLEGYGTGKLTPATTQIAAWAKPFGIEIDPKLSNKEAFAKSVGAMTLGLKNAGGANSMPGSLSDSDRKFLEGMSPSLSDTPEGNRLVIDYYKRVANRQMDMAQQSEKYFDENGTYKGFRKQWDEYVKTNPLFASKEASPMQSKRVKITADMLKGGAQ
jgi:hypothetical protein